MANEPEFAMARNNWLSYLRSLQLTEAHGWHPSNSSYGGWSYAATGLQPIWSMPHSKPVAFADVRAKSEERIGQILGELGLKR